MCVCVCAREHVIFAVERNNEPHPERRSRNEHEHAQPTFRPLVPAPPGCRSLYQRAADGALRSYEAPARAEASRVVQASKFFSKSNPLRCLGAAWRQNAATKWVESARLFLRIRVTSSAQALRAYPLAFFSKLSLIPLGPKRAWESTTLRWIGQETRPSRRHTGQMTSKARARARPRGRCEPSSREVPAMGKRQQPEHHPAVTVDTVYGTTSRNVGGGSRTRAQIHGSSKAASTTSCPTPVARKALAHNGRCNDLARTCLGRARCFPLLCIGCSGHCGHAGRRSIPI